MKIALSEKVLLISTFMSLATLWGITFGNITLLMFGLISWLLCITILALSIGLSKRVVVFSLTAISTLISFSYEIMSKYPLGRDVHGEIHVILRAQHINEMDKIVRALPQYVIPDYYYDIVFFIHSGHIIASITSLSAMNVIKFIINGLILGIIPLAVYVYSKSTLEEPRHGILGSLLILVQTSYVVTFHSTSKTVLGFYLMILIMHTVLLTFLGRGNRIANSIATILLMLALCGIHYLTSGYVLVILVLAIFMNVIIRRRAPSNKGLASLSLITCILAIIWGFWYVVMTDNLIKPIADFLTHLIRFTPKPYAYEHMYKLPFVLEIIRFTANIMTLLTLFLVAISEIKTPLDGRLVKSIVLAVLVTLVISQTGEFAGVITLGPGRLFMLAAGVIAPFIYYGIQRALQVSCLLVSRRNVCALTRPLFIIIITFVLILKGTLVTGVLPYFFNDWTNSVFLGDMHSLLASFTDQDYRLAEYISTYYESINVEICTDIQSIKPFLYIIEKEIKIKNSYDHVDCIVYFSTFNTLSGKVHLSLLVGFEPASNYYISLLRRGHLVYLDGYTMLFISSTG